MEAIHEEGFFSFFFVIVTALLLSSCNAGKETSLTFGKRKYTKGHFFNPVAKANPVVPAKTLTNQKVATSISKFPIITPVAVTRTAPEPNPGSTVLPHTNLWVQNIINHSLISKLLPTPTKAENPLYIGGIPGHTPGQDNTTTGYGLAGLLLTIFSPMGLLVGVVLEIAGSPFFYGGNGNGVAVIYVIAATINTRYSFTPTEFFQ